MRVFTRVDARDTHHLASTFCLHASMLVCAFKRRLAGRTSSES